MHRDISYEMMTSLAHLFEDVLFPQQLLSLAVDLRAFDVERVVASVVLARHEENHLRQQLRHLPAQPRHDTGKS